LASALPLIDIYRTDRQSGDYMHKHTLDILNTIDNMTKLKSVINTIDNMTKLKSVINIQLH